MKSIESRADSQPAKKTHTLTKQDSSVYLKGNQVDKALKRTSQQKPANAQTIDARGKPVTATGGAATKSVGSTSMDRGSSVNSGQHHSTLASLQQVAQKMEGAKDQAPYFLHKQG